MVDGDFGQDADLSLSGDERWELLHACAGVAGTEAAAGLLLDRIAFPYGYRPAWQGLAPVPWWRQVFAELDRGIIANPYRRLLEAAVRVYPANHEFTAIAGRHGVAPGSRLVAAPGRGYRPPVAAERPDRARGRIFLCHSKQDREAVRTLYSRLRGDGLDPWLDEEDIPPGREWEPFIRAAIRDSAAVLVCLTARAVSRRGFLYKEIRLALDVASEQPEGAIYIIPVRLEPCDIPDLLAPWQSVDLFDSRGYEKLLKGLLGSR
jgi:hypothetical protein